MRYYLETSTAAKLVGCEAESEALREWAAEPTTELVSTHLLETELRRFGNRERIDAALIDELLKAVEIHDMPHELFAAAGGLLPSTALRSLDALHLASAQRLDVFAIASYDKRIWEAAEALKLAVVVIVPAEPKPTD